MKKTRIALIVDHPLRDLPGLALIAKDLAQKNCEVFLVPMYNQERECLALAPDFVLLNYLRKNNEHFVHRLKKCGIQYGINDTEGGFYGDLDYYGSVLSLDRDLNENVRCNLVWGQKMLDYLKSKPQWNHQLKLTGLPRFDFYADKFKTVDLSPLIQMPKNKKLALINTKVALANPLFVTVEKEIEIYKNKLGISEEKIQFFLKYGLLSIEDNVALSEWIGQNFPDWSVVIRPHPHENGRTYANKINSQFKNVSVHREGPVIPWILQSKAVLHRHCTTAIEAAIANIPAISPTWVNTSANAPDAEDVSHKAHTQQELFELLQSAEKNQLTASAEIQKSTQKIIDDWLYQVDGNSHIRVSDEILQSLGSTKPRVSDCAKEVYNIFDHRTDLKGQLFTQFSRLSAVYPKPLWAIDQMRLKKWTITQKYFTPKDLSDWINPVIAMEKSSAVQISWAHEDDSYLEPYTGHSIRVTC